MTGQDTGKRQRLPKSGKINSGRPSPKLLECKGDQKIAAGLDLFTIEEQRA
jgi:hypothetical protein